LIPLLRTNGFQVLHQLKQSGTNWKL